MMDTEARRRAEVEIEKALSGYSWYAVADQPDWQKRVAKILAPLLVKTRGR
jgi:hypothetical protein